MAEQDPIDFADLAAALLSRADTLVPQWLPGGRRNGAEWVCGDLNGGEGSSCSVNLVTGRWADFSGDDKGGDLISLYAAIYGLNNGQAARQLMADMGWQRPAPRPAPARPAPPPAPEGKRASMWRAIVPVPPQAPAPDFKHWHYTEHEAAWEYRLGEVLYGYVVRYRTSDGGKEILPHTWCVDESDGRGLMRWHFKQWDEPRPLYVPAQALNAERPVVLVEGEKCAAAGHALLGDRFDFVTWPGGSKAWAKADWSWLQGRTVVLWPDCDAKREPLSKAEREGGVDPDTKPIKPEERQPGFAAMVGIGTRLLELGCTVQMGPVPKPGAVADGWDVADAIAQGWGRDEVLAFVQGAKPFTAGAPRAAGRSTPDRAAAGPGEAAAPWQAHLMTSAKGYTLPVRENAVLALDGMPEAGVLGIEAARGVIQFNEFTNDVVKSRATPWQTAAGPWAEVDDLLMGEWLVREHHFPSMPRGTLEEAVRMVAHRHRFHPVREWLANRLPVWDGEKRLATWLRRACLAEDEWDDTDPLQRYLARVGTFFLMGMCARVMQPGVKFDYMLILEGAQGMRKSTLLRTLAGDYFADTGLVLGDKDSFQQLQGRWLYEIGELDAFSKTDITKIKQYIASASDYFRASFDRRAREYPRQVVFGGTTNEDHYLTDPTGNRRFWPVRVTRIVDIDWVLEVREQLFAEAMARIRAGARMYPTPQEEVELFAPQQQHRAVENAIESAIGRYLYPVGNPSGPNSDGLLVSEISLVELLAKVGIGVEKLGPGRFHEKQAAAALRRMGWEEARSSRPGRPRVYRRPKDETGADPLRAALRQEASRQDGASASGESDDCPF